MKKYILTFLILAGPNSIATDIPFFPDRGLVEVEVEINGHIKGIFGVDTGADYLYIDRTFAEKNGIELSKGNNQRDVVGIDGSSKATMLQLSSIEFGDELLVNQRATAIDMNALVNNEKADPPDGLLGFEVLKQFYVTVDYPNHRLQLNKDLPRIIYGNNYYEEPFKMYRHLILVDVVFDGSITAPMILDYCASHTVFSIKLAKQLGVEFDDNERGRVSSIELGENLRSNDVEVIVTDLSHYKRSTPRAKFEGLLGGTFLKDHTVTIDYGKKKIYLHKK